MDHLIAFRQGEGIHGLDAEEHAVGELIESLSANGFALCGELARGREPRLERGLPLLLKVLDGRDPSSRGERDERGDGHVPRAHELAMLRHVFAEQVVLRNSSHARRKSGDRVGEARDPVARARAPP